MKTDYSLGTVVVAVAMLVFVLVVGGALLAELSHVTAAISGVAR